MKKILALVTLAMFTYNAQAQLTVSQLIDKFAASANGIKTAEYTLNKSERINGKMRHGMVFTRLQQRPTFKVYIKILAPDKDKDTEVLYVAGERGGDALVNPPIFGVPNLNLSPTGSRMMENEHHSVFESGFEYMKNIIVALKTKFKEKIDTYCKLSLIKYAGAEMYKVDINYPEFAWSDYTVKAGEDLIKIARKNNVSEYMIMEKNGLKNYTVAAGKVIKIPNVYAKKVIFYFNKTNFLPVYQELHDDKGLFETYTITGLKLNLTFPATEFTKDHDGYNF